MAAAQAAPRAGGARAAGSEGAPAPMPMPTPAAAEGGGEGAPAGEAPAPSSPGVPSAAVRAAMRAAIARAVAADHPERYDEEGEVRARVRSFARGAAAAAPAPTPTHTPAERERRRARAHADERARARCQQPVEVCKYYLNTGMCKFGRACRFHHPREASRCPELLNSEGYPLRPGEAPCPHFARTAACKFGYECRFDHPGKVRARDCAFERAGARVSRAAARGGARGLTYARPPAGQRAHAPGAEPVDKLKGIGRRAPNPSHGGRHGDRCDGRRPGGW